MRAGGWTRLRAACDVLIAVAAVLTVVAPRWPWYKATLIPSGPNVDLTGVMAPQGEATGLYAHSSLWVAVGVAIVLLALLLVRYYRGGRLQVPGDSILLAVGSFLVSLVLSLDAETMPGPWMDILGATLGVPDPWRGVQVRGDGYTLVMTWSYGAPVAITAALALLALAIASIGVTIAARRSIPECDSCRLRAGQ